MSNELPSGNPRVRMKGLEVLSDSWYVLRRATFEYRSRNGDWSTRQREAYDRGNGATILLTNADRRTVILTRQFRVPADLNGHIDGMLIEAPAGLLDNDDAETAVRREAEEETGYRVGRPRRLFELFMSPGSVTEPVAFCTAPYKSGDKVSDGGGVAAEGEDIDVRELTIDEAVTMVERREIVDGKTVILLQWAELHLAEAPGPSRIVPPKDAG